MVATSPRPDRDCRGVWRRKTNEVLIAREEGDEWYVLYGETVCLVLSVVECNAQECGWYAKYILDQCVPAYCSCRNFCTLID